MSIYKIIVSVVTHGHAEMVQSLFNDLDQIILPDLEVVLTHNIGSENINTKNFKYNIINIINKSPKGFGANHNYVAKNFKSKYFFVLNPDLRIPKDFIFNNLTTLLDKPDVGVCSPLVFNNSNHWEDHARLYPTFCRIFKRYFFKNRNYDYKCPSIDPIEVEWCAGMFLGFISKRFIHFNGFNEKYFMYCEDADICRRFNNAGLRVLVQPSAKVYHHAQRKSRRNIQHLYYHFNSLLRFCIASSIQTKI